MSEKTTIFTHMIIKPLELKTEKELIFHEKRRSRMVFYNVKQAAREHHQKYKVIKNKNTYRNSSSINNLTGTSDNGFSSSSGSDYSYGVSAAVVMPTQIKNNIHPKNYGFNLTARSSKKCSSLNFIILNSSIFSLFC